MTMTPQQYHLDHGPKLRDEIVKQQAAAEQKENQAHRASLLAAAKAAGIRIPASAQPTDWNNSFRVGDVRIEINVDGVSSRRRRARDTESGTESARLYRRRRALCDNLSPTGANRFAAFVKTKYGKDANAATIRKAHDEWLDMLSSCSC